MTSKKEILFISGESQPDNNLQCEQEYRFLQDRIDASLFKGEYYVTFLPNSLISDIDKRLRTKPSIVHYCGHGTDQGNIIAQKSIEGRVIWKSKHLKETFERNTNLDLLVLCSCNSDKIIGGLGFPAKYIIGFMGSIEYQKVKKFNDLFYERLFIYGSALHAYIETIFVLNRDQIRGIKPVCRSKINFVMKAVLDNQEALLLKSSELTDFKEAIDFAQKTRERIEQEILITEGRVTGILYELLAENPFAQEILFVIDNKKQMADQVAEAVFFSPMHIEEREDLAFELLLFLEIVEKILGSLRQMKYTKSEFTPIFKAFRKDKEKYRDALSRLAWYQFPINTQLEFDTLWKQVIEEVAGYL